MPLVMGKNHFLSFPPVQLPYPDTFDSFPHHDGFLRRLGFPTVCPSTSPVLCVVHKIIQRRSYAPRFHGGERAPVSSEAQVLTPQVSTPPAGLVCLPTTNVSAVQPSNTRRLAPPPVAVQCISSDHHHPAPIDARPPIQPSLFKTRCVFSISYVLQIKFT
jgi:hypothetical protein